MKIWTKKWEVLYGKHSVLIEHITFVSTKTQVRLYIDEQLVGETKPGWLFRNELEAHVLLGGKDFKMSVLVGSTKTGFTLIYQLLIDDKFISGERDFRDYYEEECVPERTLGWYILNKGVWAGLFFAISMALFGQVKGIGTFFFFFFFYTMVMGPVFYFSSRLGQPKQE